MPLDPLALLTALGRKAPARATPVVGGLDAAIWRVEQQGEVFALRVLGSNQTVVAAREIAAMASVAARGIPVPKIQATGTWQDRSAVLLGWCPGRPLSESLMAQPWRAWTLGVQIGRLQAAIHAAPIPATVRDHPVPWQDWAAPDPPLRGCLAAIPARTPALLHLDYHPMNILVDDQRITAVLDWANVRAGDPRADLARTASILALAPRPPGFPPILFALGRRTLIAGWRHGYRSIAGPMSDMAPFYAWAGRLMEREMTPRLGRADIPWLTPDYLARIDRWTAIWRYRAGCVGS